MTISRSSAMYVNVLLIFDMLDLNEALFFKASFLFIWLFIYLFDYWLLFIYLIILLFTTIYTWLKSLKFDYSTGLLNLIFLLTEYWPPDKSFTSIYFLVTNFDTVESFNDSLTYLKFLSGIFSAVLFAINSLVASAAW